MTENLVEVHHLKKYFHQGRPDEVHAIDDVSFNIQRGEVFGLVGESGSGKTTTGRCILNLYQPTSGDIIYDGEDVTKLKGHQKLKEFHQKTSMIFQDPYSSLDPRMSVRDIIAEGLKIHQKITNREEFDEKVAETMKLVGLTPDLMNRYPYESPDHLRLNQNLLLLTNHYQLWMFLFRHKLFNSWNTSRRLEI